MKLPEVSVRFGVSQNTATSAVITRWRNLSISLLWLSALTPILLVSLFEHQIALFFTLLVALVVFQFWRIVFRLITHTSSLAISGYDVVYAVLIALLVPLDIPAWQIVISTSFGYVFAERLFGGRGFGFLSPVVLALSFVLQAQGIESSETPIASVSLMWLMPGIMGLLWFELVSYRSTVAIVLAVLVSSLWMNYPDSWSWYELSPVVLVIFFLVSDPATAASSNPGRWVHGFLYGFVFALLMSAKPLSLAPPVNAALLASLAVPLIDYLVAYVHMYRRRHRHA